MLRLKILILLGVGIIANCLSCALPLKKGVSKQISFEEVMGIPVGASSSLIRQNFGKPDKIDHSENQDEYWVYLMPGFKCCSRVTFRFGHDSSVVESKSFAFLDEKESILENFLKFFPNVKFKSARRKETGHHIPNEIDYSNEDLGIYFTVGEARAEVEDVTWINPLNKQLNLVMKR